MSVLQAIYYSLSTRELASITLLGLFLIWAMRSGCVRRSMLQVIKSIFAHKVLTIISILCGWIVFVCHILYLLRMWDIHYIKDVILFAISTIPLLIKTIDYKSQYDFGTLIVEQVKYAAFISVYVNLYTLSYWLEILLQLSLALLILMKTTIERQNTRSDKQLYGCLNRCNTFIGYFIVVFLIYQTCTHPLTSTLEMLLIGVTLPFILTIFITPFLYLITIYGAYEVWFIRLKYSVNHNQFDYSVRKKLLLKYCKLNLKKIKFFEQYVKLFLIKDNCEFIKIVQDCNFEYKINNKY